MNNEIIKKEDYEEPECPIITRGHKNAIPMSRIFKKLDGYLVKKDYAAAERLLQFWLGEAELIDDRRGQLSIYNELLEILTETRQKDKAYDAADKTLKIINELEISESITAASAYVNIAAAYESFNDSKTALAFYEKADKIYSEAIKILSESQSSAAEAAITYLKKAELYEKMLGAEEAEKKIASALHKAFELINSPALPRDGYYAFVCEKCAPTFGYYGYFLYENELLKKADEARRN